MIEDAPRSADDDVDTRRQRFDLFRVADATIDRENPHFSVSAQVLQFRGDLVRQFPGREHDEGLNV